MLNHSTKRPAIGMSRLVPGLVGIIFLLGLLNSEGSGDKFFYFEWAHNFLELGPKLGYEISGDYPPLTMLFMALGFSLFLDSLESEIAVLQLLIGLFFVLTAVVLAIRFRDVRVVFFWSLLASLGAFGMLGIDVWFAPFLVAALWSLERRKVALFVMFFLLAVFIKWQALIIAPFLAVYILRSVNLKSRPAYLHLASNVALPAAILVIAIGTAFGFAAVLRALAGNLGSWVLSGNATNFNWIVTWAAREFFPALYGPTDDGLVRYIVLENWWMGSSRFIFFGIVIFLLVVLMKGENSFEKVLLVCSYGGAAYFVFNPGVHVNHLFLAALLALYLAFTNSKFFSWAISLSVLHLSNIALLYGFDASYNMERVVFGFDLSVALAVITVVYFAGSFAQTFTRHPRGQTAAEIRGKVSP